MTVVSSRPVAPDVERRLFAVQSLEVREADGESGAIPMHGYAAMFNSRSHILSDWFTGAFVEEIAPGAFQNTIRSADVRLLINHDPNLVLARTRAETLRLSEDDRGLVTDADMAPTTYANDLAISLRRGDVSQMSFAFRTIRDEWAETEEGMPLRRLLEVSLYDVSVVTYPAYEATEAGLRGMQQVAEGDLMTFFDRLITQDITPASLPVLRAAREALATRLDAADPHEKQSEVEAPRSMDIRHRFNARKVEADTWI